MKVRVAGFSISLDGFGAGPEQSLENPLGKRGRELHQWLFGTRMFQTMIGKGGGSDGVDQDYAHRSMDGFGAFILGRVSTRIVNEVKGINRVVYDVTSKPPGTIEWE